MIRSLALAFVIALPAAAQPTVSAKPGQITDVEGDVSIDGAPLLWSPRLPSIHAGQTLSSGRGRAEVLLSPCVVLRLDAHSAARLVGDSLAEPQVELRLGSAIVDAGAVPKRGKVTLRAGGAAMIFRRTGLYRVDLSPPRLRVLAGRAEARRPTGVSDVGAGRAVELDSAAPPAKFDVHSGDAFFDWSSRRASFLARQRAVRESQRVADSLQTVTDAANATRPIDGGDEDAIRDPTSRTFPNSFPLGATPPMLSGCPK